MKTTLLLLLCTLCMTTVRAQTPATDPYAEDTKTVESTISALYGVISGPVGQARDWARFLNLYLPQSHLGAVAETKEGTRYVHLTPEDYISRSGPKLVELGFHERELARQTQAFGPVVHVFTTYESRKDSPTGEVIGRGINSIQLVQQGGRWYILSVLWTSESATNPIPTAYLPG